MHPLDVPFDAPPWRLSGVVYGTLLNRRAALAALGDAVRQAPYKAPPRAPVLYVKPRNTLVAQGGAVAVPADVPELEVGAALGIVIGRTACAVNEADAPDHVAGYTIVADVGVPHDVFYRPSVRFKARDGFCPIGPRVVTRDAVADPDALALGMQVDGQTSQRGSTAGMQRPVARLLADVSEFMTLAPGDILMLGVSAAVRVRAGQHVAIQIDGIGRLEVRFVGDNA